MVVLNKREAPMKLGPTRLRMTVPVKPPALVRVIVEVVVEPMLTRMVCGVAAMLNGAMVMTRFTE